MNMNIKHISSKELWLTIAGIYAQINWNMEHKNFALVIALKAGVLVLETEYKTRAV